MSICLLRRWKMSSHRAYSNQSIKLPSKGKMGCKPIWILLSPCSRKVEMSASSQGWTVVAVIVNRYREWLTNSNLPKPAWTWGHYLFISISDSKKKDDIAIEDSFCTIYTLDEKRRTAFLRSHPSVIGLSIPKLTDCRSFLKRQSTVSMII